MAAKDHTSQARRVELGVYIGAAVVYVLVGFVLRSVVLNWVVGPLWFILSVTFVTPFILRLRGIDDPDGKGAPMPTAKDFAKQAES